MREAVYLFQQLPEEEGLVLGQKKGLLQCLINLHCSNAC